MSGACSKHGRGGYRIFVGKPEGDRQLRKPSCRWDLRELGFEGVDVIHQAKDREQWRAVVNTVMYPWVP